MRFCRRRGGFTQFIALPGMALACYAVGWILMTPAQAPSKPVPAKEPEPYPIAVAVGPKGTIYIADHEQKRIYRLDEGNKLTVLYKGSSKYRTPLFRVFCMAADSAGNLFICDTGSMDVWRMSPDAKLSPLTGQKIARGIGPVPADQDFDREGAYAGKFDKPMAVTLDADGNPVVADLGLGAIFRVPAGGGEPQQIAQVPAPRGIALDREGSFVVVSHGKDQLVRVSAEGEVTPIVKGPLAPNNFPHQVVIDQHGYVVSDGYAKTVWRVSREGEVKPLVKGDPLVNPVGIALEPDGNILVMDPRAKKLFRVTSEGKISVVVSFPGAEEKQANAAK